MVIFNMVFWILILMVSVIVCCFGIVNKWVNKNLILVIIRFRVMVMLSIIGKMVIRLFWLFYIINRIIRVNVIVVILL